MSGYQNRDHSYFYKKSKRLIKPATILLDGIRKSLQNRGDFLAIFTISEVNVVLKGTRAYVTEPPPEPPIGGGGVNLMRDVEMIISHFFLPIVMSNFLDFFSS